MHEYHSYSMFLRSKRKACPFQSNGAKQRCLRSERNYSIIFGCMNREVLWTNHNESIFGR